MIDKHILSYLRYAHGFYNITMAGLFCYQGLMGLRIRKSRTGDTIAPVSALKWHRKNGRILVAMGILGFATGLFLISVDKGKLLEYPLHLIAGLAVVFSILTAYAICRKIRGMDSSIRNAHFFAGAIVICLYFVSMFLGLGILL